MKFNQDGLVFYVVGEKKNFTKFNKNIGRHLENVTVKHLTDGKQLRGRTPSHLKKFIYLDATSPLLPMLRKKYSNQFINLKILTASVEKATRNNNIFQRYYRNIPKVQPVESGK